MTGDRTVVASFLEKGADPIANFPFARQDDARVVPGLPAQSSPELARFTNFAPVDMGRSESSFARACLDDVEHIDDAEWHTTAMHEACASGNVDVLKRLKPSPRDDLAGMLERAAFFAHRDVLAYLRARRESERQSRRWFERPRGVHSTSWVGGLRPSAVPLSGELPDARYKVSKGARGDQAAAATRGDVEARGLHVGMT